jgi:hypothetical protein
MAQDSRKKRHNRRKKIAARVAAQTNRQQLRGMSARLVNTQFTLLAVLKAAPEGAVTVAKEAAETVMHDFASLRWVTERRDEDGAMVVTLVDDRTEAPAEPKVPMPARPRSVTARLDAEAAEAPVEPARTDIEGA